MINNEDIDFYARFRFFWRHADDPDWHSGYKNLYAYITSIGFKILI